MNVRTSGSYYQTQIGADYYHEAEDAQERQDYYAQIADRFESADGTEVFQSLHRLLSAPRRMSRRYLIEGPRILRIALRP